MTNNLPTSVKKLINGYKVFSNIYIPQNKVLFNKLKEFGQQPKIAMVSCCDSRVDPAIITNSRPGEIFMIRNVANIVPPCEIDTKHHGVSAGLEYAVTALNVDTIIIMGHSDCGGIKSLFTDNAEKKPNMFIDNWLDHLQILAKEVKAVCNHLDLKEKVTICSKKSILHSVDNLLSFPFIKERYDANLLNIFGWYFEIDDAKLIQIGRNGEHIEL